MSVAQDTEQRIIDFLEDYPEGKLRVTVGYTSIWGLAWLNRHTEGRQVDLLIGNTDFDWFESGTRDEREEALDFLGRKNVTVKGLNQKIGGISRTIMIAWHIDDDEPHLLAGSAHLSKNGLKLNAEMMAEIAKDEIEGAVKKMDKFFGEASDCRKVLVSYVDAEWLEYQN